MALRDGLVGFISRLIAAKPVVKFEHHLTVGELRSRMAGLPDNTPVYYERIEDSYFKPGKGWTENTLRVPDFDFPLEPDEYVRAFTAFGRDNALLITAHY